MRSTDEYKKKYIREFDSDSNIDFLNDHVCKYYKTLSKEEQDELGEIEDCFDDPDTLESKTG